MLGKTLKEIIIIAKEYGITLSYKYENGKRKRYTKAELIKKIIEKFVADEISELERTVLIINDKVITL